MSANIQDLLLKAQEMLQRSQTGLGNARTNRERLDSERFPEKDEEYRQLIVNLQDQVEQCYALVCNLEKALAEEDINEEMAVDEQVYYDVDIALTDPDFQRYL